MCRIQPVQGTHFVLIRAAVFLSAPARWPSSTFQRCPGHLHDLLQRRLLGCGTPDNRHLGGITQAAPRHDPRLASPPRNLRRLSESHRDRLLSVVAHQRRRRLQQIVEVAPDNAGRSRKAIRSGQRRLRTRNQYEVPFPGPVGLSATSPPLVAQLSADAHDGSGQCRGRKKSLGAGSRPRQLLALSKCQSRISRLALTLHAAEVLRLIWQLSFQQVLTHAHTLAWSLFRRHHQAVAQSPAITTAFGTQYVITPTVG